MAEHKSIYAALAAAQSEMGKAIKQSENPHFRSKYADLGAVMDACMPALNKNGIVVVQPVVENEFGRAVKTVLYHTSGESLDCEVPLIVGKQDMQGLGSAVTYARRYGLMCMAGIAPEDDDGNAAVKGAQNVAPQGWAETIIADLPPGATARDKADAVATALCAQYRRAKGEVSLRNMSEKHAKDYARLARFPEMQERVDEAYAEHMAKLTAGAMEAAE